MNTISSPSIYSLKAFIRQNNHGTCTDNYCEVTEFRRTLEIIIPTNTGFQQVNLSGFYLNENNELVMVFYNHKDDPDFFEIPETEPHASRLAARIASFMNEICGWQIIG